MRLYPWEPTWVTPTRAALMDYTVPGFFHHGAALLELVRAYRPERMVEVGTYLGKSAIPLARLVHQWYGTLVCVDLWEGAEGQARMNAVGGYLERAGVTNVTLIRQDSVGAALTFPRGSVDAVFVDGSHEYPDVVRDLDAWAPVLRPGGLLAGDDYGAPLTTRVTRGRADEVTRAWHDVAGASGWPLFTEHGRGNPGLVWVEIPT